jgi:lactate racemase
MEKLLCITMPYGKENINVYIEKYRFAGLFSLRKSKSVEKVDQEIERVLIKPIGCKSFIDLIRNKKKVLIVCDDITRRTPVNLILPHVLKKMKMVGIEDKNITILIATGSHRSLRKEEIIEKIGQQIYRRIKVVNHDCKRDLVFIGKTKKGTPIYINKLLKESDFIVGIGNIIPHRYCGWSGGGKIIQPGVCGEETIAKTHLLITKDSSISLGSISNIARSEINEVAKAAGLRFIINTILDSKGQIIGIVAGEPESAHIEGVKVAQNINGIPMPLADIVVISSFPEDLNLWQALKALYVSDVVVKNYGIVILVSPLYEGVGEHTDFIKLLSLDCNAIMKGINNHHIQDLLSGAAAFAISKIADRTEVLIVSEGISDEIAHKMRMKRCKNLQNALNYAITKKPLSDVVFIKEGTEILPLVKGV